MNNNSKPFNLNAADVFRSFALAVVIAVVGGFQQMLTQHGFSFGEYDWAMLMNMAISAFVAQMGLNFASNPDRTISTGFGKIGPKEPNA